MKSTLVSMCAAAMILVSVSSVSQAASVNSEPGGAQGLITGCCFGLRVGADYNQSGTGNKEFVPWFLVGCCFGLRAQEDYVGGKEMSFRDWCPLIPYVGVIFRIWDGIDTMNGKVRKDLQQTYGSSYY